MDKRSERVAAGVDALQRWLEDLLRQGLARRAATAPWEETAARMVDAHMPGVARALRSMGHLVASEGDWSPRLLDRIGRLALLCQGWRRIDSLSPAQQADVRTALGWTWPPEAVLEAPGEEADWQVLGEFTMDDERLWAQRTWLYDPQRHRPALLLAFSHGGPPLDTGLPPGTWVHARLGFFPGTVPQRALLQERRGPNRPLTDWSGDTVAAAVQAWQARVVENPWLERSLLVLRAVVPLAEGPSVQDSTGRLPVHPDFDGFWPLLARCGGRAVWLAGEWDGEALRPLSARVPRGGGGETGHDGEFRRL